MIQLTYEPAFDPLHAMFRSLRLHQSLAAGFSVPRNLFRILDFYILFPQSLNNVKFKSEHRRLKKQAIATERAPAYGPRPEDPILFERMRPFQDAAVETLALHGFFSASALEDGWINGEKATVPEEISERIRQLNAKELPLIETLVTFARDYPLEGPDGLKSRTGLLEHRYDAV